MRTEDEEVARLLEPLAFDPTGPSTIDIGRAIADGRRIRRRRTGMAVTATVTATLLVVVGGSSLIGRAGTSTASGSASPNPTVAPVSQCKISELPVPDGRKKALVTGMDPSGHLILGYSTPTGQEQGSRELVIWRDGKPSTIQSAGSGQSLDDINTKGVAVGSTFSDTDDSKTTERPLVVNGAAATQLAGIASGKATAINEAGVIVGTSNSAAPGPSGRPSPGMDPYPTAAVRWDSPTATAKKLPVPQGTIASTADAITEDGRIIGTITKSDKTIVGYVWHTDGTGSQLQTPGLANDLAKTRILIRGGAGDWVVGSTLPTGSPAARSPEAGTSDQPDTSSKSTFGSVVGLLWNIRTGAFRAMAEVVPDAVAETGWAVGSPTKFGEPDGMLQMGGTTVKLPALTTTDGQTTIGKVISADGKVIAGQSDVAEQDDAIRPVTWTCS